MHISMLESAREIFASFLLFASPTQGWMLEHERLLGSFSLANQRFRKMFLHSAISADDEWQKHSITTGNLDLHVFERVLLALKKSPRFALMTRVFCLKMKLQKAWSPSIAAQSSKTHVLWYNLTITHCCIYKALLQIIFVIFTPFSTHFVPIK